MILEFISIIGQVQLQSSDTAQEPSTSVKTVMPPDAVVLRLTPSNDLRSLCKYRFNFHPINRGGGLLGVAAFFLQACGGSDGGPSHPKKPVTVERLFDFGQGSAGWILGSAD